jgi:flavin reductase (DIM6/NTAB) family NADH-FMN oxidoreductase RutF
MVLDFTPVLAIMTGPWNHSFEALRRTKECVLAIPAVDLLDTVVGIGTCSGSDVDKFERFGLTARPAKMVGAPLVGDCLANIECRVTDHVPRHNIFVLEALAAWHVPSAKERRTLHAVGDGTFVADGRRFDRRRQMAAKLPSGL